MILFLALLFVATAIAGFCAFVIFWPHFGQSPSCQYHNHASFRRPFKSDSILRARRASK